MTETETEVSSKNTPAITDYRHRCREREQNENLWDYDFNHVYCCNYDNEAPQTLTK